MHMFMELPTYTLVASVCQSQTIAPLQVRMAMTEPNFKLHPFIQPKVLALLGFEGRTNLASAEAFCPKQPEQPPSVEYMLVSFFSRSLEQTVLARTALLPP